MNCFKCNQDGHMARDCPNQDEGRSYKRQRRDDGGSIRRDDDQGNNDWNAGTTNDAPDQWNAPADNNYGNQNTWGNGDTNTGGGSQGWGNQ